jgi:hypothetical protein
VARKPAGRHLHDTRPAVAGIVVPRGRKHDHARACRCDRCLLYSIAVRRSPTGFIGAPGDRAHIAAVRGGRDYGLRDVLRPIDADIRGFACSYRVRGASDLDVERHFAVRVVLWNALTVRRAIDRHIRDVGRGKLSVGKELCDVGLGPAAA